MAAGTVTVPTKLKKSQVSYAATAQYIDFTDHAGSTFKMLLVVAGSGAPNVTNSGVQFVADVTGSNAEVTGTGYSRATLSGVAVTNDGTTNTQVDWNWSTVTFAQNASGFTNARYAVIYTTQLGSADASYPVVCIIDLGSNQSVASASLSIAAPASNGVLYWS